MYMYTQNHMHHMCERAHLVFVCIIDHVGVVVYLPVCIGILHQHTTHMPRREIKSSIIFHHHFHSEVVGPGLNDGDGLGVTARVHEEDVLFGVL